MVTVRSDQTILTSHASLTTRCNGLLTVIQVAEAANLSLLVQHVRKDLHSAHDGHLVEEASELLLVHGRLRWQLFGVQVMRPQYRRLQ